MKVIHFDVKVKTADKKIGRTEGAGLEPAAAAKILEFSKTITPFLSQFLKFSGVGPPLGRLLH